MVSFSIINEQKCSKHVWIVSGWILLNVIKTNFWTYPEIYLTILYISKSLMNIFKCINMFKKIWFIKVPKDLLLSVLCKTKFIYKGVNVKINSNFL